MRILRLFIDENIKTWKKFSTKLALILILLALIGSLGLVKLLQHLNEKDETNNNTYNWKTDLQYDTNSDADFSEYINYQRKELNEKYNNKEITRAEYDDEMLLLNLREKFQIGGNTDEKEQYDYREDMLNLMQKEQKSIRTGIDYNDNKVLTSEKKKEYEDDIKIKIYEMENNIVDNKYVYYTSTNYRLMFESLTPSFVIVFIAIAIIIIAGGEISSEISTGTIKFWALTPNKRWKILTAKILSLLFYLVVITLIMSILSVICANVFFDTSGYEYLYVKNGNVEKIGNTIFTIEYYFAKMIPVIFFVLFALMLSVITKNTSVAIGVTIAIYMGNNIAMLIINSYIKKDWIRFIPFNNLNIATKIFPNFENMIQSGLEITVTTSLGFAFADLGTCIIIMLVIMYSCFNKRDII